MIMLCWHCFYKEIRMAKVSIIVPVYNAGGKLRKLLDSLLAQSLKDIEVICVLDCPTDGSDEVLNEYAKLEKRVCVLVNSSNRGIGYSRNVGIEEAIKKHSAYITFADHDDWVEPTYYEEAVSMCEWGGYDVLRVNSQIEKDKHSNIVDFEVPTWKGIVSSLLLPMESKYNRNYLARSVWNALYRTDFIKQHNLYFLDRNLFFEEDTLFNLRAYSLTKKVGYLNKVFYHWLNYDVSTSEKIESHEKVSIKMLNFLEEEWNIMLEGSLLSFKDEYYRMLSLFLRRYFTVIQARFTLMNQQRLANLLRKTNFPVCGRYEDMKLLSKVRIRLFVFVCKLKYLCQVR